MARTLLDGIVGLLFCLLVGVPAILLGLLASHSGLLPGAQWWHWAMIPPAMLVFLLGLLLTATLIRFLLPRLKAGDYPFPRHRQSFVWLLHFSLQRLMYLPLWRHFMFSFSTLRWLLLHALGAKAAFEMDTSSDVLMLDLPMIELGAGTMIGAGCTLSGHLIENQRLFLGKVRIARGVQVASSVVIGPGTVIGEHSIIGPECRIARDVSIGEFAHLGAACYLSAGVRVGDNAVLGHQVSVDANVTIGAGAVIETGTRLARGTAIGPGEHFPARQRRQEA